MSYASIAQGQSKAISQSYNISNYFHQTFNNIIITSFSLLVLFIYRQELKKSEENKTFLKCLSATWGSITNIANIIQDRQAFLIHSTWIPKYLWTFWNYMKIWLYVLLWRKIQTFQDIITGIWEIKKSKNYPLQKKY